MWKLASVQLPRRYEPEAILIHPSTDMSAELSPAKPRRKPSLLLLLWWRVESFAHLHHEKIEHIG